MAGDDEQGSGACAGCGAPASVPTYYEADGTIHVRYGSGGEAESAPALAVTFIPRQHVEQSGSKFVVFVPRNVPREPRENLAQTAVAVEVSGSGVDLGPAHFGDPLLHAPLLHAAAQRIKVTVVVSRSNGNLTLEEIVFPAIPRPAT